MRRLSVLLAAVLAGVVTLVVATPALATIRFVEYRTKVVVDGGVSVSNDTTTWELTFSPNSITFPDGQCAHLRLEIDIRFLPDPTFNSESICSISDGLVRFDGGPRKQVLTRGARLLVVWPDETKEIIYVRQ